jgi:hypothetical protein
VMFMRLLTSTGVISLASRDSYLLEPRRHKDSTNTTKT